MEDLDTQKVREILEYMKEFGAVFIKYGELIIEFPRPDTSPVTDGIGFRADSDNEEEEDDTEEPTEPEVTHVVTAAGNKVPGSYINLFGGKHPRFSVPSATGKQP